MRTYQSSTFQKRSRGPLSGAIDVPDQYLAALVRGLLDGDGSIRNVVHEPTRRSYPEYRYERLWVFFHSASNAHIEWLRSRLRPLIGSGGYVEVRTQAGKHDFFKLKYGKHASIVLLQRLYEDPKAPRLVRKWAIWDGYERRNRVRAS